MEPLQISDFARQRAGNLPHRRRHALFPFQYAGYNEQGLHQDSTAKGLPEWRVNLIHGFRVALTPVVVLIGFRLPTLIGGSVVIETIFQWPGIGNAF